MPITILIIESDRKLLASIKKLLIDKHYQVFGASSPERGIKLLHQYEIDLILFDKQQKNDDGFGFLQALIQNPLTELIPFIFITSDIEKNDVQLATYLGGDGFILKPIDQEIFWGIIERKLKKYNQTKVKTIQKHLDLGFAKSNRKKLNENIYIFRVVNNQPTFIKVSDIKYAVAKGAYLEVYLSNGNFYKRRKSISELEKSLPANTFLRIHRSTIINLEYVEKVEKWFNNSYRVYLKGINTPLEISRRYASTLRSL